MILNFVRKERALITIFLVSGKKFVGQVVGFDRYTIHIRGRDYDQIVFKHAITNISVPHPVMSKLVGSMGEDAPPSASFTSQDWSGGAEGGDAAPHDDDQGV